MERIEFGTLPEFEPLPIDQANRSLVVQQALDLLLHSRYIVPQDALISLEVNRIYLGDGGFVVTGFRPLIQEDSSQLQEILLNLEKLVNQVYDGSGLFHACQMDGQVIVLSCFPQLSREQNRDEQLNDLTVRLARKVTDLCREYWKIPIMGAVGPVIYSLAALSSAFFFVTELMEYKQFLGDVGQLFYEPEQLQANQLLRNTKNIQKSALFFANDIYSRNLGDVESRVDELITYIIESEASSMRNFHFCLLLFVQALTEALLDLEIADNVFLTKLNILGTCYSAQNRATLNRYLCEIFREIEANYSQQRENRLVQILKRAKEYIDENYTDSGLSVGQIAELVGIHQSTLSTMFKRAYGETVVNYIRDKRVDKAKELLSCQENMNAVAKAAGFGSLNTMYRAFKAKEGLPPGKLR